MRLKDYIQRYAENGARGVVRAVAEWQDEQARTPDRPRANEAAGRIDAHMYSSVASDLRDQTIEEWE